MVIFFPRKIKLKLIAVGVKTNNYLFHVLEYLFRALYVWFEVTLLTFSECLHFVLGAVYSAKELTVC